MIDIFPNNDVYYLYLDISFPDMSLNDLSGNTSFKSKANV